MSAAIVKHLDPTQVELEIEIADAELQKARDRAFRELVRNVRIPGFRPGKAPRKIFEAQYGTAQIEERAMNAVVPDVYSRALQENDLDPIDQPQMELLPEAEGQPLRVRATVSVRPQIELHDYKGVALVGASIAVSDEQVENALQELRKDAGTLVPADRPVQLGDVPTIDYAGTIDGVPFEGGSAEGQATEIAENRFIPGFAAGIVGLTAGQTKDVEAHFPEDYGSAELAGKTAVFTITVHENKVAELPALDDEFARRFGREDGTLATLRDELRNRLEASARQHQRRDLTTVLLQKLMDAHDFGLPAVLVDREAENLRNEAKSYIERAGVTWDDYLQKQGKSEESLVAEYRADAERRVKSSLLVEAIAKAEAISATSADVEAEVQQLSAQYRQPREAILEMLRSNFNALVDGIVRTKTIEFLLEQANISEADPAQPVESAATGLEGRSDDVEATNASPT